MNRLFWYLEWIDYLLCGVRYCIVMLSLLVLFIFGLLNSVVMLSGGWYIGICLLSLVI